LDGASERWTKENPMTLSSGSPAAPRRDSNETAAAIDLFRIPLEFVDEAVGVVFNVAIAMDSETNAP